MIRLLISMVVLFFTVSYIAQEKKRLYLATGYQFSYINAKVFRSDPKGSSTRLTTTTKYEIGEDGFPIVLGYSFKKIKTSMKVYNSLKNRRAIHNYQINLAYKLMKTKRSEFNVNIGSSISLVSFNQIYISSPSEKYLGFNAEISYENFSLMYSYGFPLQNFSHFDGGVIDVVSRRWLTSLQLVYEIYPFKKRVKLDGKK